MEKTTSKRTSWLVAGIIAVVLVGLTATGAMAATLIWDGGGGDSLWNNPLNWCDSESGSEPTNFPQPDDTAIIDNDNTVVFNDSGTYLSSPLGKVIIDYGSALNQDDSSTYLSVINTQIGIDSVGTYSQSAGIHNVVAGDYNTDPYDGTGVLTLGIESGSTGTYNLSGEGSLSVGWWEYVGYNGVGYFNQSGAGSTHTVTDDLNLGYNPGSYGEYNLYDGTLDARFQYVGGDNGGVGVFNQYGGTNTLSGDLILGHQPGATGSYYLNEDDGPATLTVNGAEIVGRDGTGIFLQEAGDHDVNGGYQIWVAPWDPDWKQYAGLVLGQNAGSSGTFTLTGGTLDVAHATIVGAEGSGTFNLGESSISEPMSAMAAVGGPTHTTGDLYVGYLSTRDDEGNFTSQGVYNLYSGTLNVIGGNGLMGFTVIGGKDYNPVPGTGEFNQYGGDHYTGGLFLADTPGSFGTYNLFDGTLSTGGWNGIGGAGTGIFNQYGGTYTTSGGLSVGANDFSNGTYILNNGDLVVTDQVTIGSWGTGYFEQNGGTFTNTTNAMYLGDYNTGDGTYIMNDGILNSGGIGIGEWGGTGLFRQYGGTVNVQSMGIARQNDPETSYGTYELYGGDLNVGEYLNIGVNGIGNFMQEGGASLVGSDMAIGTGAGEGAYAMKNGNLDVGYSVYVGATGLGTFTQDGGGVRIGENLILGNSSTGSGAYNLSGGDVSAKWIAVGNNQGTGEVNHTGGNLEARLDLVLAQGYGSTGTYHLSEAGSIHSLRDEYLGAGGTGTFVQDGGSNIMDSTLVVGWTDGEHNGSASYTLNDGYVQATNVIIDGTGSATGRFDLNGGELNVTNDLVNNDTFNYSGGTLNVANAITNNATFKTTNVNAEYNGTFNNNGAYISDPSVNTFKGDLVVGTDGYLQGGAGDEFNIFGNFVNNSLINAGWNTDDALLGFLGNASHEFYLTGEDFGGNGLGGYHNNFAWDTLDLTGESLSLFDGNGTTGAALYVDAIFGAAISDNTIANIFGQEGFYIYYLASDARNNDLAGLTYNLTGGGFLKPAVVPIPGTVMLLFSGLMGVLGLRRFVRKV